MKPVCPKRDFQDHELTVNTQDRANSMIFMMALLMLIFLL
jgi:hypothetical protein